MAFKLCPICGAMHTERKYCSSECCAEGNRRLGRDRYRMRQGLSVDPAKPTKPWGRFLRIA
jgi:hypothetical protein